MGQPVQKASSQSFQQWISFYNMIATSWYTHEYSSYILNALRNNEFRNNKSANSCGVEETTNSETINLQIAVGSKFHCRSSKKCKTGIEDHNVRHNIHLLNASPAAHKGCSIGVSRFAHAFACAFLTYMGEGLYYKYTKFLCFSLCYVYILQKLSPT